VTPIAMIPEVVLIATCSFDRSLGAERVAGAIARGLARVGHDSLDQCPLTWDGSRREQLLAELDERRFDERLRACRALIVAEPSLQEPTLRASATFELATRARQGGVPALAVTARNSLGSFDARILDLQAVLEGATPARLSAAGRAMEQYIWA